VEWALGPVIDDIASLFDAYGVKATFFVTHAGVTVRGHERALHPNFRRNGDTYRALVDAGSRSDHEVYEHIVTTTYSFAPEAKGVRAHSLHFDSTLLPIYRRHGLEYECSQRLPLVPGLRPFWNQHDMIFIPSYFSDYFDLLTGTSRFDVNRLMLDRPGLKVLDFHPNIVFGNFADEAAYRASKPYYHDPERLLALRGAKRGVRTLLTDLLEYVARSRRLSLTLGELNRLWRSRVPRQWD
jgi:peptidoglycan/xylan/chitin deacetylase (PgdA/CDA1 family)